MDTTYKHAFDDAVALTRTDRDTYRGQLSRVYGNMVGPFGGAIAATLLNAVLSHPERLGDPLSMTVNFAGPIADEAFEVVAKAARTNRATQHWSLSLMQGGETAVTATALFGVRRETWSSTELHRPDAPPASDLVSHKLSGFPAWTKNYDFRFVRGAVAIPPNPDLDPDSVTTMWVRDEPRRPLDFLSLMALSDCFFPRVFIRRQKAMPAGTVSMTTYFHADTETLSRQGDREVLATARALRFYRGYFDQAAELWSAEGDLLCTTNQLVYFKD